MSETTQKEGFTDEMYDEFVGLFPDPATGHKMLEEAGQDMNAAQAFANRLGTALKSSGDMGFVAPSQPPSREEQTRDSTAPQSGDTGLTGDATSAATGQVEVIAEVPLPDGVTAEAISAALGDTGDDETATGDEAETAEGEGVKSALLAFAQRIGLGTKPDAATGQTAPAQPEADQSKAADEQPPVGAYENMTLDQFMETARKEAKEAAAADVDQKLTVMIGLMDRMMDRFDQAEARVEAEAATREKAASGANDAIARLSGELEAMKKQFGLLEEGLPPMATIGSLLERDKGRRKADAQSPQGEGQLVDGGDGVPAIEDTLLNW